LRVSFLDESTHHKIIDACLPEQMQHFVPRVASILAEILAKQT
jgi:hypothetical protein